MLLEPTKNDLFEQQSRNVLSSAALALNLKFGLQSETQYLIEKLYTSVLKEKIDRSQSKNQK